MKDLTDLKIRMIDAKERSLEKAQRVPVWFNVCEAEKIITALEQPPIDIEGLTTELFSELEEKAYDVEHHHYFFKEANQTIRSFIKAKLSDQK